VRSGVDGHAELTAHYEQLRGDILNHAGPAHGFGLALLLQQGMTAWMRAWSECTNELQTPSASAVPLAAPLPWAVRSQLTLILASMLTRPRQEARP
jgi:hypothetical protein